eukprot:5689215-Prymnesium_polylepis.1
MQGLEIDNLRLKEQVKELEEAVREMNEALRESTRLLLKTRPVRPAIPHERKLLQAASQKWKCANPYGSCLLHKLGTGLFDESLFECDHVEPYAKSFRSVGRDCKHSKRTVKRWYGPFLNDGRYAVRLVADDITHYSGKKSTP